MGHKLRQGSSEGHSDEFQKIAVTPELIFGMGFYLAAHDKVFFSLNLFPNTLIFKLYDWCLDLLELP